MDLQDFISTTLKSIQQGIENANTPEKKTFRIVPHDSVVKFDIAVEASKEGKTAGEGGVKIHVLSASFGKDNVVKESNVSRISFSVGVGTIMS